MRDRRILHLDMDAFFTAIELQRHPELKGKAVIVGGKGDPSQRGVVSTANYEARKYGIHSGMPLRTAYKHCPEAVFLPVDYSSYSVVSHQIKKILKEFSPQIEDVGIDEAFLDISDVAATPEDLARSVKQRVREQTGLTCSVGVAHNKLLAKMASDMDKPDGLTIITDSDIETRIWPLSVRKLRGIGPKTEQKLAPLGVKTIGELAKISLQRLITLFGKAHGCYLYEASRGIDDRPLMTQRKPKSLGRETTFQEDVENWPLLRSTAIRLVEDVVNQLRNKGYRGKTVTVKLRFADFDTRSHAKTLSMHTDDQKTIEDATIQCLTQFALTKKVRLIGIRISGLEKARE